MDTIIKYCGDPDDPGREKSGVFRACFDGAAAGRHDAARKKSLFLRIACC